MTVEECDIREILRQVTTELGPQASAQGVKLVLASERATILADPLRLGQVIRNLTTNAIKFSNPGSDVVLRSSLAGGQVTVKVIDVGRGIPPDQLGRIFDWRAQVKREDATALGGCGLGLAIAEGIVVQHGGTIRAISEPGCGTTFTVEFPVLGSS